MKSFINPPIGRTSTLEVERESGWAVDQEPLVFAGRQLEYSRSLADYNIQREATIDMVTRNVDRCCVCVVRASEDAVESDKSDSDSEDGKRKERVSCCNDGWGSRSRGRRKRPSSSSRRLIADSYGCSGWRFWWQGGRKSPRRC